ncbi:MAG: DUF2752 domain-containing protein [Planctomycetes bacterium]|nr:DUF2752 domain-containing protein [Planctomycetota bacterium]MBL7041032.1 DUF2752 domain-containing protein [Pirellulaceae bacterium]
MNRPKYNQLVVLSWLQRLFLIAAGSGLIALFVTAGLIGPDPRGFGTHQRLGLPPCTFRQLTGVRCPSCGMTTSWSHLVRGQVFRSFRANAGGAILGITAMLLAPWSFFSGLRGRWLWRPIGEWVAVGLVIALLAITLADWGIRCFLLH